MNTYFDGISVPGPASCYLNDLMKESAIPRPFTVWRPPGHPILFLTLLGMLSPRTGGEKLPSEKFWGGSGVSLTKLYTGDKHV